jgi:hypothetical protein
MDSLAGSKNIKKQWKSSRQRIARKHDRVHSYESSPAAIHCIANMLGTILKQYNSASASRIRPQIFNTCGHLFQSRTSLGNPTIFNGEIQASAYKGKGYHKSNNRAKSEENKSRGNLYRNISQADSTIPRMKELHSS